MATIQIHQDDIAIANIERNTHIIQIVRQRMQVIWLISEKYTPNQAAEIAGVCMKSVKNYIRIYKNEGLEGLRALNYKTE
jgi:transposase